MRVLLSRAMLAAVDLVAAGIAVWVAFGLRFDWDIPSAHVLVYLKILPIILPVRLLIFYGFGLYRQMWSHASVPEVLRVVWAVSADSAATALIIYLPPHEFPRSVLIMGWVLMIGLIGSVRLFLRIRPHWNLLPLGRTAPTGQRTIIYGAGDAGAMLAREFVKHPDLGATLVGFLDDDPGKQGYHVAGKPVLGTRAEMAAVVQQHGVTHLVIAVPSAPSSVIRQIVERGRSLGLHLKTLPGLVDLVNGRVTISQIRDVQIEDVLGREEVKVDLVAVAAYLRGETVLVTGAGGSIGSELCRQVVRFAPKSLILLGHGENSIYEIDLELRERFPDLDIRPVIADVQDEARLGQVFAAHRPGVVFHAAAHKHVPLMEENPAEAIKNNVFGTWNVARAARDHGAKRFVLVSSDKAVNPTSVMGATKRAAEYVVQSLTGTGETVFVAVRFGNVLGSRGSVIPRFKRQISTGGPITITDPRMVRYFMTIPEAVQLVIQAASMGHGGEVFALDMGEPVKIVDLARDLIRLSGLEPDVDIPVIYTGMRPGEKLYEELLTAEEGTVATTHQRIFVAPGEPLPQSAVQELLGALHALVENGDASNSNVRTTVHAVSQLAKLRGAGD